ERKHSPSKRLRQQQQRQSKTISSGSVHRSLFFLARTGKALTSDLTDKKRKRPLSSRLRRRGQQSSRDRRFGETGCSRAALTFIRIHGRTSGDWLRTPLGWKDGSHWKRVAGGVKGSSSMENCWIKSFLPKI